jgi:hypothetical protein
LNWQRNFRPEAVSLHHIFIIFLDFFVGIYYIISMKYYIEFPINVYCNLQCNYCFHSEAFEMEKAGTRSEKYMDSRGFSLKQYIDWRNKHLADGTDFLMELHGGEMSHPKNQDDVIEVISTFDKEKFQIQTNGLGSPEFYQRLFPLQHKINRLGFTYHRFMIGINSELTQKYEQNVLMCKAAGLNVYVKELLMMNMKDAILQNKHYWMNKGVDFRIQDFKGMRGSTYEEYKNYSAVDQLLIYPEYRHYGDTCSCRVGYKNVHIRGFGLFEGDVVGCWKDPTVIGNILKDWYNPNYIVGRDENGNMDVKVKEKIYRGTYPKDRWQPGFETKYKQLTLKDMNKN